METLLISIRDETKRDQIEQLLHQLDGVEHVERIQKTDEATVMAQASLAEEWDSPEDQRWDSLL